MVVIYEALPHVVRHLEIMAIVGCVFFHLVMELGMQVLWLDVEDLNEHVIALFVH